MDEVRRAPGLVSNPSLAGSWKGCCDSGEIALAGRQMERAPARADQIALFAPASLKTNPVESRRLFCVLPANRLSR